MTHTWPVCGLFQKGGGRVCKCMHARAIHKVLTQSRTVQKGGSNHHNPPGQITPCTWQGPAHMKSSATETHPQLTLFPAFGPSISSKREATPGGVGGNSRTSTPRQCLVYPWHWFCRGRYS